MYSAFAASRLSCASRLREERLVAIEIRVGLRERRLKRTAIEREEQLTGLHEVAFVKENLLELSGDLRSDRDRRVRFDVADRGDVDRHVFLGHLRGDDRRVSAASAAAASTTAPPGDAADVLLPHATARIASAPRPTTAADRRTRSPEKIEKRFTTS